MRWIHFSNSNSISAVLFRCIEKLWFGSIPRKVSEVHTGSLHRRVRGKFLQTHWLKPETRSYHRQNLYPKIPMAEKFLPFRAIVVWSVTLNGEAIVVWISQQVHAAYLSIAPFACTRPGKNPHWRTTNPRPAKSTIHRCPPRLTDFLWLIVVILGVVYKGKKTYLLTRILVWTVTVSFVALEQWTLNNVIYFKMLVLCNYIILCLYLWYSGVMSSDCWFLKKKLQIILY